MASPRQNPLAVLTSMRLTVALLVLSVVIVFTATLDQVHLGVWGVQEKYFRSFFVFTQISGTGIWIPVFPGGYLLGGALIVNLVAAHVYRFRLSWRKSGIWLTHIGLILLIVGGGPLRDPAEGQPDADQCRPDPPLHREASARPSSPSSRPRTPEYDDVVSIPSALLTEGALHTAPEAALHSEARGLLSERDAEDPCAGPRAPRRASRTAGAGTDIVAMPIPVTTKPDEANWPTGYVELVGPDGPVGTFLVSEMLLEPETFTYQGRTWRLALGPGATTCRSRSR